MSPGSGRSRERGSSQVSLRDTGVLGLSSLGGALRVQPLAIFSGFLQSFCSEGVVKIQASRVKPASGGAPLDSPPRRASEPRLQI